MARAAKDPANGEATAGTVVPDTSDGLRLRDHPRARRSIVRAKGIGGLAGFALGMLLALRADLPFADVVLRALLAGVGMYLAAWAAAVTVWRQLARAEIEHFRRILVAAHERAEAEVASRRAVESGGAGAGAGETA